MCLFCVFFFSLLLEREEALAGGADPQHMPGPVVPSTSATSRTCTFVCGLHVFLVERQAVALHRSRVELQAENHLALRRHVALVVAFDLQGTNTTNKMVGGWVGGGFRERLCNGDCWEVKRTCGGGGAGGAGVTLHYGMYLSPYHDVSLQQLCWFQGNTQPVPVARSNVTIGGREGGREQGREGGRQAEESHHGEALYVKKPLCKKTARRKLS